MDIIGDDCVASFVYYTLHDLNLCYISLGSLTYLINIYQSETFVGLDIDMINIISHHQSVKEVKGDETRHNLFPVAS